MNETRLLIRQIVQVQNFTHRHAISHRNRGKSITLPNSVFDTTICLCCLSTH